MDFHLPVTDPVWIFFIVMTIILFAPMLLERLRIPHIIGMILAGILVGEFGFNILERDSSFELFGKVGLFYIMFLAGLEMDMEDFRKNKVKGLVFGLLTFIVPMALGVWSSMSLLDFGFTSSVLLASMYASHTLVAYPIVSRYGLSRQRSVNITIGGTAVTVTLALVILAVIGGMYKGEVDGLYWLILVLKVVLLGLFIVFCLPRVARWFFRKYDDAVMQFVFILASVFFGGGLMAMVGMEGILGAFLVGMVLNPLVPRVSPLMNRIEFVGNAIFIPYFLIGVGMIIDIRSLFASGTALKVAVVMTVVATFSKWLAAFFTQKLFRMNATERGMMFGLSNAQAAATLAAVLVGHGIILSDGTRLLNDDVLNGTVVMILFTCIISSVATEFYARKFAIEGSSSPSEDDHQEDEPAKIMIPIANPETIDSLVNMALVMRNPKVDEELIALNVISDESCSDAREEGRRNLEKAAMVASAADVKMNMVSRCDVNVTSGIIHTVKEFGVTDIILGLHRKSGFLDSYFGSLTGNLLRSTSSEVLVVGLSEPLNTIYRITVVVPPRAEYESGFAKWVYQLLGMAEELDCKICFKADMATSSHIGFLSKKCCGSGTLVYVEQNEEYSMKDALLVDVRRGNLLIVVSARGGSISYDQALDRLPSLVGGDDGPDNLIVLYPEQSGHRDLEKYCVFH